MTRRLIATILATSMAFTSLAATPVRAADSGEIGRFLLGAGTLFIIGSAIANNSNGGSRHQPYVTHDSHSPYVAKPYRHPHAVAPHNNFKPPHKVKPRRKVLPRACLRVINTGHGNKRVFIAHCLQNRMRHANRLPDSCLQKAWIHRQPKLVYRGRCLRRHGYVVG